MRKLLFVAALALIFAAPVLAAVPIVLVDDGFESGDMSAWTVVTNAGGLTPQVFSAANPMEITEVYDDNGSWAQRPSGQYATAVTPSDGTYALGWSRLGPYQNQQYFWVSQYFTVTPGEYILNAAWDAVCWNLERPDEPWAMGAKGLVLVGADYDQYGVVNDPLADPSSARSTLWNQDSGGAWVSKSVLNKTVITTDGRIEVRLAVHDKFDTEAPNYEWAAFDNVYVEMIPVNLVPEPGSLLALATGFLGLGGLVIRRRK